MSHRGVGVGFYLDREAVSTVLRQLKSARCRYASISRSDDGNPVIHNWGLRREHVARFDRWCIRNETIIIAETAGRSLGPILEILRQEASSPPVAFLFTSRRVPEVPESEALDRTPARPDALADESAGRLARTRGTAAPGSIRGATLLRRLTDSTRELERIQETLADSVRTGQAATLAADWLLDNAYIIEGQFDDVRRNLPRKYYEKLPVTAHGHMAGLTRS